jgi:hypothetical protein
MEKFSEQSPYSEQAQEAIHLIEKLSFVSVEDKVNILLTFVGIKPVSEIKWLTIQEREKDPQYKEQNEKEIEILKDIFTNLSLTMEYKNYPLDKDFTRHSFNISNNAYTLDRYKDLEKIADKAPSDDQSHQREYAIAFGYPQTAMEGFINDKLMPIEDLPLEVKATEEGKFMAVLEPFRLSKSHWQEELSTMKVWADTIKNLAPDLYKDILSKFN